MAKRSQSSFDIESSPRAKSTASSRRSWRVTRLWCAIPNSGRSWHVQELAIDFKLWHRLGGVCWGTICLGQSLSWFSPRFWYMKYVVDFTAIISTCSFDVGKLEQIDNQSQSHVLCCPEGESGWRCSSGDHSGRAEILFQIHHNCACQNGSFGAVVSHHGAQILHGVFRVSITNLYIYIYIFLYQMAKNQLQNWQLSTWKHFDFKCSWKRLRSQCWAAWRKGPRRLQVKAKHLHASGIV